MKILVSGILSLCCLFVVVFGSNETDLESNHLKVEDSDPSPIQSSFSTRDLEGLVKELKEQVDTLSKKFDQLENEISSHLNDSLTDLQSVTESCVLEEKWVTVHQHNNTSPADVKPVVRTMIGAGLTVTQDEKSNSSSSSTLSGNFMGHSHCFLQAESFARIGKSKSTGFDWTATPFFLWTRETPVTKEYICQEGNSCVYKQLVGQCGNFQVPVDQFCIVSVPLGNPIPELCTDAKFTSCSNVMEMLPPSRPSKQRIYPDGNDNRTEVKVLCDFNVDGGGWTVIQKRSSGSNFDQAWENYVEGFGSLDGNFWLGLQHLHTLTKNGDQELRIELEDLDGRKRYAKYSNFEISDASNFYKLTIGGYSGDAGDSMSQHDGTKFSTRDNDNDSRSCASTFHSGWWFHGSCFNANLNGIYREKGTTFSNWKGIHWKSWKSASSGDSSLAKTEMKIRPRK